MKPKNKHFDYLLKKAEDNSSSGGGKPLSKAIDDSLKLSEIQSLQAEFNAALAAGDTPRARRLAAKIAAMGGKAASAGGIDIAEDKHQAEMAQRQTDNEAYIKADEMANRLVANRMNSESRHFYEGFEEGKKYKLLKVHDHGHFDPGQMTEVDGAELKAAFAKLEYGRMNEASQDDVIERIERDLGKDTGVSKEERLAALQPSLELMEQYKAAKIYNDGVDKGESLDSIQMKISSNHDIFERTNAQVDKVSDMHERAGGPSAALPLQPSMSLALGSEKNALRNLLSDDVINGVLLEKSSLAKIISGGMSPEAITSGLAVVAKTAMSHLAGELKA